MNAEKTLTSLAAYVLDKNTIIDAVIALTGECGHYVMPPSPPAMAL